MCLRILLQVRVKVNKIFRIFAETNNTMKRESLYEKALRLAKQDHPDGNLKHIRNSARHYFVFLRKQINGRNTLIKENGKYKFVNQ